VRVAKQRRRQGPQAQSSSRIIDWQVDRVPTLRTHKFTYFPPAVLFQLRQFHS
jgi:hypothetical protein